MVTRVAVIGAGGMGEWFARFFKSRGDSVTVSDHDPRRARLLASKLHARYASNNREAARKTDVVILATPTGATSRVINEILPVLDRNALICDISATKSAVIPALLSAQKRGIRVASIHPMFGPLARGIRGRRVVAVKTGKDIRGYKTMKHLLEGAHFFLTDPEVHDKHMAVTLALPHFLNMAFGMTVSKRRNLAQLRRFAGRTFDLQMLLAEAIANESETVADIQIINREFRTVLRGLQRDIQALAKLVDNRDRARLVAQYKEIRRALSTDPEFRAARRTFEKVSEAQSPVLKS